MNLALDLIHIDDNIQPRAQIDQATVADYRDAMLAGQTFPAVTVFHDGTTRWLADGFHRVAAAEAAGLTELPTEVRDGSRRDAILFAAGANATHGLRRTNADKRRAVETLLQDDEWKQRSDRWIAVACAVSDPFVGKLRRSLQTVSSAPSTDGTQSSLSTVDGTRQTRDGRTMDTSRIGRREAKPETPPGAPAEHAPAPPCPTPPDATGALWRVLYAAPSWSAGGPNAWSEADLRSLPIADLRADAAALLLWVPGPALPQAMRVIEAWNFRYADCTGFDASTVESDVPGLFEQRHELVLVARRGALLTRTSIDGMQAILSQSSETRSTKLWRLAARLYPGLAATNVLAPATEAQTDEYTAELTDGTVDAQDSDDTTDDDDDAENVEATAPERGGLRLVRLADEGLDAAITAAPPAVQDVLRHWTNEMQRRIHLGGPWRGGGNATSIDVASQVQHVASEARRDPEAVAHGLLTVMEPFAPLWSPMRPSSNVSAAAETWRREHPKAADAVADAGSEQ